MSLQELDVKSFRGCVLIQKEGQIIVEKATGYAELANEIPNTIQTKFATASAGKVFVAVGILQLIERGQLRFDDTMGELLNIDLNMIDPHITVEELLTHQSGIPDYFDESIMDEYEELWVDYPNYKIRRNHDLLPLFCDKPMMYPRGSKFQYNNTGYVVLAMIIEEVTGLLFDEYLTQTIFNPCQMTNTGYYELDCLPANCATNYIYDESRHRYRSNIYSVDVKGTGAGGAFTTIHDIKLFWHHLLAGNLLTPSMTSNMLANHSDELECYGYGIWLKKNETSYVPYFQGSDPGVSFITSYDIQKDLLIVLVSNYGDNVWQLLNEINEQF